MNEYRIFIGEGGTFGLGSPISTCGTIYIAYREADGPIVVERDRILFPAGEELYQKLSKKIGKYCVIRVLAERVEHDFREAQLLEADAPLTADEKEFLRLQALPVTFQDEQFGEFVLDKQIDWYEGAIPWGEQKLRVTLDEKENIESLRELYGELDSFLKRAASYAASELLELGNDWCEDAWADEALDGEEFVPMTKEDFVQRISLESISLSEEGAFTLWYEDGDIFWGHSICVEGSLEEGFTDASMQG